MINNTDSQIVPFKQLNDGDVYLSGESVFVKGASEGQETLPNTPPPNCHNLFYPRYYARCGSEFRVKKIGNVNDIQERDVNYDAPGRA